MCMGDAPGGGGSDDAAQEAREAEERRQANIRRGKSNIDSTFERFDDSFYGGIEGDALGFYEPELDRQYQDALRAVTLGLARSGNLAASAGNSKLEDLEESLQRNQTLIADRSRSYGNQARSDIEAARSELYAQNTAAADPSAASANAIARADVLSQPPVFSPLEALFAEFTANLANSVRAEQQGFVGTGTGLFSPTKTKSSLSVVN